jgi:hypothetical protein
MLRISIDRLCGLVVRVPGYSSRGPGFDSLRFQIFWEVVGLERDPLSLLSTMEELLWRKVAAPVWKTENISLGIRLDHHVAPSVSKIKH